MKKLLALILLILNIPVLLLLIMAMLSPYIPPDKIAFPAFAGLAFFWIFLANLLIVILLLFTKAKWAMPGVVILLFSLYDVSLHYRFPHATPPAGNEIKLLSYNCQGLYSNYEKMHGKTLSDSIAQFIANHQPDIVCLQEFRGVKEAEIKTFMDDFSKGINAHDFHYQRYFIDHTQNSSLCLITLSRFPVVNRNAIQLGKRRIGMYTDLLIWGDTVRVFNIHLQSTRLAQKDIDFVMNTAPDIQNADNYKNIYRKLANAYSTRAQQARLIALEINKSPHPVIVCGDFNDTPTSFAYHRVAKSLEDAFINSGKGMGNTYNNALLPPIRIDYILYSNIFKSNDFTVIDAPYSDHFPIMAVVGKK
ncbi:MAG: endonuclease/exonuclease/phosphatase family protein [Bacteroidales bacterium]|nr:endonuclease/exonuclease/phosphatase family protein [Bacteroidales bacterium]